MRHYLKLFLPALLACLLSACSEQADVAARLVSEAELFTWSDQPVRFSPPAGNWKRHRWKQSGLQGVSFHTPRVPAGRILVAHYHQLYRNHSRRYANGDELTFEPATEDAEIEDVVDRVRFRPDSTPWPLRRSG